MQMHQPTDVGAIVQKAIRRIRAAGADPDLLQRIGPALEDALSEAAAYGCRRGIAFATGDHEERVA